VPEPTQSPGRTPDLTLVPERSAVLAGGHEVSLTPTQFRLLAVLLKQPGRAFTRAELVKRGIGDLVTERTVDVHVKELRRRLGAWGARVVASATATGPGRADRAKDHGAGPGVGEGVAGWARTWCSATCWSRATRWTW
jgi:hypothetical protein